MRGEDGNAATKNCRPDEDDQCSSVMGYIEEPLEWALAMVVLMIRDEPFMV